MDSERRISCSEAVGLTEMTRLRVPGMGSGLADISGSCEGESKLGKSEFRRSLRRINSLTRRKLSPNGRAGGTNTPRKNSRCSVSGGGGDGAAEHSEEETSFLNEKCDSSDQWSNNQKQRKKERS